MPRCQLSSVLRTVWFWLRDRGDRLFFQIFVSTDAAEPQYLPLIPVAFSRTGGEKGTSRETRLHVVPRERTFSC